MAKTKRVHGVDLPARSFAYVGDENDTNTWKLALCFEGDISKTRNHLRNALSRFADAGGIPQSEKYQVWQKITGACAAHGIEVDERDAPPNEIAIALGFAEKTNEALASLL